MSKVATNKFTDGLTLDTHPLVSMDSSLTNCLNGTLLTLDGNEQILQNDTGNKLTECALNDGFEPLAIKEYNGIIYILSRNHDGECEIGSYPSPSYDNKDIDSNIPEIEFPTENGTEKISTDKNTEDNQSEELIKLVVGDSINWYDLKANVNHICNSYYIKNVNPEVINYIKFSNSNLKSIYDINVYLTSKNNTFNITQYVKNRTWYIPSQMFGTLAVGVRLNQLENMKVEFNGYETFEDGQYSYKGEGTFKFRSTNVDTELLRNCYYNFDAIPVTIKDTGGSDIPNTDKILIDVNGNCTVPYILNYKSDKQFDKIFANTIKINCINNAEQKLFICNESIELSLQTNISTTTVLGFTHYFDENGELWYKVNVLFYKCKPNELFEVKIIPLGYNEVFTKQLSGDVSADNKTEVDVFQYEYRFKLTEKLSNGQNLSDQWCTLIFELTQDPIDVQYIIPFSNDVYNNLSYSNFRSDINLSSTETGRIINETLSYDNVYCNQYYIRGDQIKYKASENELPIFTDDSPLIVVGELAFGNISSNFITYLPDINIKNSNYNISNKQIIKDGVKLDTDNFDLISEEVDNIGITFYKERIIKPAHYVKFTYNFDLDHNKSEIKMVITANDDSPEYSGDVDETKIINICKNSIIQTKVFVSSIPGEFEENKYYVDDQKIYLIPEDESTMYLTPNPNHDSSKSYKIFNLQSEINLEITGNSNTNPNMVYKDDNDKSLVEQLTESLRDLPQDQEYQNKKAEYINDFIKVNSELNDKRTLILNNDSYLTNSNIKVFDFIKHGKIRYFGTQDENMKGMKFNKTEESLKYTTEGTEMGGFVFVGNKTTKTKTVTTDNIELYKYVEYENVY